jgi:hypothetical protein
MPWIRTAIGTCWRSATRRFASWLRPEQRWVHDRLSKIAALSSASSALPPASTAMSVNSAERFQITHYRHTFLVLHIHDTRTNAQWVVQCSDSADLAQFVCDFHSGTNTRVPTFLVSGLPHPAGD